MRVRRGTAHTHTDKHAYSHTVFHYLLAFKPSNLWANNCILSLLGFCLPLSPSPWIASVSTRCCCFMFAQIVSEKQFCLACVASSLELRKYHIFLLMCVSVSVCVQGRTRLNWTARIISRQADLVKSVKAVQVLYGVYTCYIDWYTYAPCYLELPSYVCMFVWVCVSWLCFVGC